MRGCATEIGFAISVGPPDWAGTTLQENQYNRVHWRGAWTVRKLDPTTPANGIDQMGVMYYSASWQMLKEDIDDGYNGTPPCTLDRRAQQFWRLRHIDVGREATEIAEPISVARLCATSDLVA